MLGKLGQPQLIPVWLRLSGGCYCKRRTLRSEVFGNRKEKHCNVWMRKSKSKGPREKSRPKERARWRCKNAWWWKVYDHQPHDQMSSLKLWMLAAGTSQLMIAKGGSDIPSGFIPGGSLG